MHGPEGTKAPFFSASRVDFGLRIREAQKKGPSPEALIPTENQKTYVKPESAGDPIVN